MDDRIWVIRRLPRNFYLLSNQAVINYNRLLYFEILYACLLLVLHLSGCYIVQIVISCDELTNLIYLPPIHLAN